MKSIFARLMLQKKIYFAYTKSKHPFFFMQSAERSPDGEKNREVKSSVLVDLMYEDESAEENERSFYNALHFPTPEFYTLYNGKDFMEKEKILKLSDAFETKRNDPMLELKVRVINISPEAGHELLERCPIIREYSEFIEIIRKYQKKKDVEPYKHAIEECIEKGILADYLKRKRSEVVNMLTAEYDYETDIEVQRGEAYDEGREEGKLEEKKNLIKNLYEAKFTVAEISKLLKAKEDEVEKIINC